MNVIDNTEKLAEFCQILSTQPFITVDSEFIREHSYYPKLCLLQIGYDGGEAIVDPMTNLDLSPFFDILQNPNIVKVFHSGRQDIEIFYNLSGKIPQNIFDTQIAAMVCGFPESISYGNLVEAITGTKLDKSCRLTDWSLRPLDEEQLQYAICDVTYLVKCYEYLHNYMVENNRMEWIKEETEILYDEKCYHINPEEAWLKFKHSIHNIRYLSALKYLATWRERRAQKYDCPRQSILKDEVMLNIASTLPKNIEQLRKVRNLKSEVANGHLGEEIIKALKEANSHPCSKEEYEIASKNITIQRQQQSLLEILKLLLKLESQKVGVVAKIIASDEDLCCIINHEYDKTATMEGWRYEIFGQVAQKMCLGELSISYNPQTKDIDIK